MLGRGGILLCPRGFPAVTVRLKLRDGAAKSPCTCGLDSEIYTLKGSSAGKDEDTIFNSDIELLHNSFLNHYCGLVLKIILY